MKRDVPVNGKFDIDAFAEILQLAKNNKTLRDFSKDCGLSEGYLSRYLHKKTLTPPSIKTLTYIANATTNPYVTLEKLLSVSGYEYEKDALNKSKKYYDYNEITYIIDNLIIEGTGRLGFLPATEREDYQDYIDYPMVHGIEYFDYCSSNMSSSQKEPNFWAFNYVCLKNNSNFSLESQVANLYGNLVKINFPEKGKYSFVTHDNLTYDTLLHTSPVLLPIYISVILIDVEKQKISKETYLRTRIEEPSKEFKKRISLTGNHKKKDIPLSELINNS